jgi:hypothetical protein
MSMSESFRAGRMPGQVHFEGARRKLGHNGTSERFLLSMLFVDMIGSG